MRKFLCKYYDLQFNVAFLPEHSKASAHAIISKSYYLVPNGYAPYIPLNALKVIGGEREEKTQCLIYSLEVLEVSFSGSEVSEILRYGQKKLTTLTNTSGFAPSL